MSEGTRARGRLTSAPFAIPARCSTCAWLRGCAVASSCGGLGLLWWLVVWCLVVCLWCRCGLGRLCWWLGGIATIGAALRRVAGVSGVYGRKTPRVVARKGQRRVLFRWLCWSCSACLRVFVVVVWLVFVGGLGGIATIGAALRRVVGVSGVYGRKIPRVVAQSAVHLGGMRVTWGVWGVVDHGLGVVASPCGVAGSARAVLGVFQWVRPLPMSGVAWWLVVWLVFVGGLGGIATIGAALRRVAGVSGVYGRKTPRAVARKGQGRVPVEGSMVAKLPSACSKCSPPR